MGLPDQLKRIKAIAVVLWLSCTAYAQAQSVSEAELLRYASQWLKRNPLAAKCRTSEGISLEVGAVETVPMGSSLPPVCLVHLSPRGYILMNADRRLRPIVGFSFSTDAELEPRQDNALFQLLLVQRQRDVRQKLPASASPLWDVPGSLHSMSKSAGSDDPVIGPLLATAWSQGNHYNEYCLPAVGTSEYLDGRTPVGCVAVACAQVMKYHEWPWRGRGSFAYEDADGQVTGAHTVLLSDRYDWANMQNEYYAFGYEPNEAVEAISELMYEVGVVAETNYEPLWASTNLVRLAGRMAEFFFYEPSVNAAGSEGGPFAEALLGELIEQRPCVASIPGHAFVVDGHMADSGQDFFHVNYGWGGQNNGWYLLDDVNGDAVGEVWTGIRPMLTAIPLESENTETGLELRWVLPPTRAEEAEAVDVLKRMTVSGTFSDPADDFSAFEITSTSDYVDWVLSPEGFLGACFHKPAGGYSNWEYHMTSTYVFRPGPESVLEFKAKYTLLNDRFSVAVSTDDGASFSPVWSVSGAIKKTWTDVRVPLGSFSGQDIQIRFDYAVAGYYATGGVWIDEVAVTSGQWYEWSPIQHIEEPQAYYAESTVTFWDPAEEFGDFAVTSTHSYMDWSLSGDGFTGSCFYKPSGGYGNVEYHLTSSGSLAPGPNTLLAFKTKYGLAGDGLSVLVSTDGGVTFSEIWRRSGTIHNLWEEVQIPLTAFSGQDIELRFQYIPGSHYSDRGVWLDDIRLVDVTGAEYGDFPVYHASLADLSPGTHVLAYQIISAGQAHQRSESFTVTVPPEE